AVLPSFPTRRSSDPVQPLPAVPGHAGREDGLLPGPGGQLEALQLLDHREHAAAALAPGVRGDVLPAQQEPDEVPGRDRLDLAPRSEEHTSELQSLTN